MFVHLYKKEMYRSKTTKIVLKSKSTKPFILYFRHSR